MVKVLHKLAYGFFEDEVRGARSFFVLMPQIECKYRKAGDYDWPVRTPKQAITGQNQAHWILLAQEHRHYNGSAMRQGRSVNLAFGYRCISSA